MSETQQDSEQKKPRSRPRLPTRDLPPSREEILSRGEQASQLLRSPVFNVAVRAAIDAAQESILTSAPGDTAAREAAYYRMRGMNDILGELAGFVHVASAMTERERLDEEAAASAWDASLV